MFEMGIEVNSILEISSIHILLHPHTIPILFSIEVK